MTVKNLHPKLLTIQVRNGAQIPHIGIVLCDSGDLMNSRLKLLVLGPLTLMKLVTSICNNNRLKTRILASVKAVMLSSKEKDT
jgi:hypothetical protein